MKRTARRTSLARSQEGSVLVLVAFSLVVLLGMTALAIDLGMLFTGRSEAQRAADAGAHAGAGVFLIAPGDEALAREQARTLAESNPVRRGTLEVRDEDIDVIMDSLKVRVRVYRTQARGNPVATLFARVLGIPSVDISAVAAAQAWPSAGVNCVLPLIMPDRWSLTPPYSYEWPGAGDTFDPDEGHFYKPWSAGGGSDPPPTGYGTSDRGWRIQITMGDPNESPQPGFYYPIRLPGAQGGADFRAAVRDCWDPDAVYEQGMEVIKEPGNMIGPTLQGFRDLIAQDPDAIWNETKNCVTDQNGNECRGSERIRPMLMFNPEDWPDIELGAKPMTVQNFVGVFVESVEGMGDVWVRFINYTGVNPAAEWTESSPLPRILRIVE